MLPVLIKATLHIYFLTNSMEFTLNNTLNIISRREICKQIGVSRDTLKNWIKNRNFPEPLRASGREPLFDELSVKEWFLNEGGNNEK